MRVLIVLVFLRVRTLIRFLLLFLFFNLLLISFWLWILFFLILLTFWLVLFFSFDFRDVFFWFWDDDVWIFNHGFLRLLVVLLDYKQLHENHFLHSLYGWRLRPLALFLAWNWRLPLAGLF